MKFFEQFLAGDRVEVDVPIGGLWMQTLEVNSGERGTVLEKRKGNWPDPVSVYIVEMDYPCEVQTAEVSGRLLRKVLPGEDKNFVHKSISLGSLVTMRLYESLPTQGGILLPDNASDLNYAYLNGTVLEKRLGRRRNEPDCYLVKWDNGETAWHGESGISVYPLT